MLKLFPDDSWVHAHYGNWAWTQERYGIAEKHLKKSLELQDIYPWASFRLGVVYFSQEKWEQALDFFEDGLKHDPENKALISKIEFIKNRLAKGQPTIPSTLEEELQTNIFLRSKNVENFSKLRELKDNF